MPPIGPHAVDLPAWIVKTCLHKCEHVVVDDRVPRTGTAGLLAVVDRAPGVSRVAQHAVDRGRTPPATAPGRHVGLRERCGQGPERVPGCEALEHVRNDGCLLLDQRARRCVAGQPRTERWAALFGPLDRGALLPGALALDFGPRDRSLDPCVHPPAVGRQVGPAVGGDQEQAAISGGVDPVLKLSGLPREPVEVPADQGIERADPERVDERVIARPHLAAVGRRDGVVDVLCDDSPPAPFCDLAAVLALALHGELLAGRVEAHMQVDRTPCWGRGGRHAPSVARLRNFVEFRFNV